MKTDELIMALQKLKVQTGSLTCLGGCMGCIGHMNPEARLCTDCDETFCAWQWNGGASHDRP